MRSKPHDSVAIDKSRLEICRSIGHDFKTAGLRSAVNFSACHIFAADERG
jgi:hypothetical protein